MTIVPLPVVKLLAPEVFVIRHVTHVVCLLFVVVVIRNGVLFVCCWLPYPQLIVIIVCSIILYWELKNLRQLHFFAFGQREMEASSF